MNESGIVWLIGAATCRAGANRAVLQSSRASSAKAPWKRAPNDPQKQGVGAPKLTATRNTDGQETMAVQNGRSNWMRSSAASPAARKPLQKGEILKLT